MAQVTAQPWVIGNWKLNPYFAQAQPLFAAIAAQAAQQSCQVALAMPAPYLGFFAQQQALKIAAQDVSTVRGLGAFTGEVSAELLRSTGVELVLVGHSERRELFADDVCKIQQKISNTLQAGLSLVYCVGESLAQREAGLAQEVVLQQLADLVTVLGTADWPQVMIAYEPIWAIGTGKTASPQDAQQMHAAIRQFLAQQTTQAASIPLLYGGSVKAENALELAACADINGALVGGASLDAQSFMSIVQAFAQ
jgi:triosephosphate isomerase